MDRRDPSPAILPKHPLLQRPVGGALSRLTLPLSRDPQQRPGAREGHSMLCPYSQTVRRNNPQEEL